MADAPGHGPSPQRMILRSRTLRLRRVRDDAIVAEVVIKPNKTEELYTAKVDDFAKARSRLNATLATACVLPGLRPRPRTTRPATPPVISKVTAVLHTRPDKGARERRRATERRQKTDDGKSLVQVQQKRSACPVSSKTVRRSVAEAMKKSQSAEVDSCATTSIESSAAECHAEPRRKAGPRKKTRRPATYKVADSAEHARRCLEVYTQAAFMNDLMKQWLKDSTQMPFTESPFVMVKGVTHALPVKSSLLIDEACVSVTNAESTRLIECFEIPQMNISNLHKFFLLVQAEGGFTRVNKNGRWDAFPPSLSMSVPQSGKRLVAHRLKRVYSSLLRNLEKSLPEKLVSELAMPALRKRKEDEEIKTPPQTEEVKTNDNDLSEVVTTAAETDAPPEPADTASVRELFRLQRTVAPVVCVGTLCTGPLSKQPQRTVCWMAADPKEASA